LEKLLVLWNQKVRHHFQAEEGRCPVFALGCLKTAHSAPSTLRPTSKYS
jgi:hypothetical protein